VTTREKKSTDPLDRAVANLLRLASWNVKDAELLSAGRNPENAPFLMQWAVHRVVEAVVATEHGWPMSAEPIHLGHIPDENPLKLALARVANLAQPPKPLALLPDGDIPREFDREAFRRDVAAVRSLLQDLAKRFSVDLLGNEPAEQAAPVRPEAAPQPDPPKARQKPQAVAKTPASPESQSRVSPATPPKEEIPRPSISVPDTRAARRIETEPHEVDGRSPIDVAPSRAGLTSAAFWTLMDRWNVPDFAALELIGHPGGLSKKGTRPRFKLAGEEAEMVKLLVEIDQALSSLGLDPEHWLKKPVRAAPFEGATVIAYLTHNGLKGVRDTSRYILKNGLKFSMTALPDRG
jgi:hypothetical protein